MNLTCSTKRISFGIAAAFALAAGAPAAAAGHGSIGINPAGVPAPALSLNCGPEPTHGIAALAHPAAPALRSTPPVIYRPAPLSRSPATTLHFEHHTYRNDHYHYYQPGDHWGDGR